MPIRYASKRNADAEFQKKNNRDAPKVKKSSEEANSEVTEELDSDAPAISPNVFYFLMFVLFGRYVMCNSTVSYRILQYPSQLIKTSF